MDLYSEISNALKLGHQYGDAIAIHDDRAIAIQHSKYRRAAVLIAITDRIRPGLILTNRPKNLREHAGQVAFPGGNIDDGDADEIAAALREGEEEIALPRGNVRIIGTSDCYYTGSGFAITPVIGIISPDLALKPEPGEVDSIFEAPLDFVLDPRNHHLQRATYNGQLREYIDMDWQGHRIWGVTAGIIANLAKRLQITSEFIDARRKAFEEQAKNG